MKKKKKNSMHPTVASKTAGPCPARPLHCQKFQGAFELPCYPFKCGKNCCVPYLFGYKMELFISLQNNPKNLDLPYKTDVDLRDG